jgi:hypothetical protein
MKSVEWFKGLANSSKVLLASGAIATIFLVGAGASSDQGKKTVQDPVSHSIVTKTETETQDIPFSSTTVEDNTLTKGTSKITTAGANGKKTLTYKVTYTDGKKTGRKLVGTEETAKPVTQVTTVGTYVAPPPKTNNCDPNYSGCVPIASDVDCAGGSGNGPAYTSGPVRVIGSDIYGLDRDGNGLGCE